MNYDPYSCDCTCEAVHTGCVTGSTGPQGPMGPTGSTGPQGMRGPTGPQGIRGVEGPQGPQGIEGPRGPQGFAGSEGPQGEQGPTGPEGLQGATGATGERGATGPQGIQGNTGPTGATGGIRTQSFAAYTSNYNVFTDAIRLPLTPYIQDNKGNITSVDANTIQLTPGTYYISYEVSGLLPTSDYIQITPFYNNATHIEQGAYDNTNGDNLNAQGNRTFLINVTTTSSFFLQFNTPNRMIDGECHVVVIKLVTDEETL